MEVQHNSCPKCGCNRLDIFAVMDKTGNHVCVGCKKCRFKGPLARTKAEAWLSWDIAMSIIEEMEKDKTKKEESAKKSATRKTILDAAEKCVCHDRQDTHGRPEDSFGAIAELWTAYLGTGQEIGPVDVANMMVLLKIGRAKENPKHTDNWADMAGYAACAGEIAAEVYGDDS